MEHQDLSRILLEAESTEIPEDHALLLTTVYDKGALDRDSDEKSFLREYNEIVIARSAEYNGVFRADDLDTNDFAMPLENMRMELVIGESAGRKRCHRFGCRTYEVGENYAVQTMTDRKGVTKIIERLITGKFAGFIQSTKLKVVRNPQLYTPYDYLAAFSQDMPDFGQPSIVLKGDAHPRYPLISRVMAENFDRMYKEHGLRIGAEISDNVMETYGNPLFTGFAPFMMLKAHVDKAAADNFSEDGFTGMIYWSLSSGIWFQKTLLKNPERKTPNLTMAQHMAEVDKVMLREFNKPETLVAFRQDHFESMQGIYGKDVVALAAEYVENMVKEHPLIAQKVKDITLGSSAGPN